MVSGVLSKRVQSLFFATLIPVGYHRIVDASMELNYVFVLTAVAVLWRPQENAKEYAYVMQLPAMKAGEDDDSVELEMTDVVPSAADDDDEDDFLDEPKH